MELKCESYGCLCALSVFEINGIEADYNDFGTKEDRHPEEAEPYCCADMKFIAIPPTKKVLVKYNITEREYHYICEVLDKALSFGSCGSCA